MISRCRNDCNGWKAAITAGLLCHYKDIPVNVSDVAFVGARKAGNGGGIIAEPIEAGAPPTAIVKAIRFGDASGNPRECR
jgi:hypothetical protein